MLHEHKINVEEAEGLIDALEYAPEMAPEPKVEIITANPKLQDILEYARRAAIINSPVLVVGETGTGKELMARMIHQASPRRNGPFASVNCAALSESLLQSELFGHERGAFTGAHERRVGLIERTNGGTLFFDAIDELPIGSQDKLLRFIRTGGFERMGGTDTIQADVRLIAATNKDLREEVEARRFLEALFDRMDVVSLVIPPLRERVEDIPLLADYFLRKHAEQSSLSIPNIAPEAMDMMTTYHWPNNVRELQKVMEGSLVRCDGETIQVEHLPDAFKSMDIR